MVSFWQKSERAQMIFWMFGLLEALGKRRLSHYHSNTVAMATKLTSLCAVVYCHETRTLNHLLHRLTTFKVVFWFFTKLIINAYTSDI